MEQNKKLKDLKWFKTHPQLLPFVGKNYDKYKILQIGESHYIDRTNDNDKFDICYFREHWWNSECKDLVESFNDDNHNGCWFDTRRVLKNYLDGQKSKAYNIFNNPIKSFSKVILNNDLTNVTLDDRQLYNNFAFMNFYQMPSLYNGKKYWNSLLKSAKYVMKEKNLAGVLAREIFKKCVKTSIQTVDDIIDILQPNIIIFTSICAGNAYKGKEYEELIGKYKDDNRIIYTSHPSASFSWDKQLKVLGNKTGKEILEEKLSSLKNSLNI